MYPFPVVEWIFLQRTGDFIEVSEGVEAGGVSLLHLVNSAYFQSAGSGLEFYDMINKSEERREQAAGPASSDCYLSSRPTTPLFWQLTAVKHEIPPNLRFEIFYRHNKLLSPT